ncbi:MAG: hypothetical protein JSW23_11010 [Planctomycetota bacterium]|nr:MAG: hypothetical protein JSW23_11010 [Planctomycetota bacterium]
MQQKDHCQVLADLTGRAERKLVQEQRQGRSAEIKSHPNPSGWLESYLRFLDFYLFFFTFFLAGFFAGFFLGILVPPCIKDYFYSSGKHPHLPVC